MGKSTVLTSMKILWICLKSSGRHVIVGRLNFLLHLMGVYTGVTLTCIILGKVSDTYWMMSLSLIGLIVSALFTEIAQVVIQRTRLTGFRSQDTPPSISNQ